MEKAGMEWKLLLTVFASVFVAEMADKTQLVTMLFAADREVSKWTVFFGSAGALVLTSAIGVMAGALISQYVSPRAMTLPPVVRSNPPISIRSDDLPDPDGPMSPRLSPL